MEKIQLKEVKRVLKSPIPFGAGDSARCYLCNNGQVFKKYKHNYEAEEVIDYKEFDSLLEDLNKLSTENIIGPKVLVYDGDKIAGYLYEYIKGKELKKISTNTKVSSLLHCYKELINNIDRFADKDILVHDTHDRNIIYDGGFHIIDLDKYNYNCRYGKDSLITLNRKEVFKAILGKIYRLDRIEKGVYHYREIDSGIIKCTNDGDIDTLLNTYRNILNKEEPTIMEVRRKTLMRREIDTYSKEAKRYGCY